MLRFEIFDFNKYQISELDVFTDILNVLGHTIIYEYFELKWKVLRTLKKYGYYVEKDLFAK